MVFIPRCPIGSEEEYVSNLENRPDAEYELPNIIIEHVAMNPRNNNLNEIFLAYYRVMWKYILTGVIIYCTFLLIPGWRQWHCPVKVLITKTSTHTHFKQTIITLPLLPQAHTVDGKESP